MLKGIFDNTSEEYFELKSGSFYNCKSGTS